MQRSDNIGALAKATAQAQGKMKAAAKDSANPFFKSKYADLASIWEACRDALAESGLAVFQPARTEGAKVTVTTLLAHADGEWLSEDLTVTAKEESPQAIGSAITYARRYGLAAMVGVAPEDDDGEMAHSRDTPTTKQERPPAAPRPPIKTPEEGVADVVKKRRMLTAQRINKSGVKFERFVADALGAAKSSDKWTEDDLDKLEAQLAQTEDVKF